MGGTTLFNGPHFQIWLHSTSVTVLHPSLSEGETAKPLSLS